MAPLAQISYDPKLVGEDVVPNLWRFSDSLVDTVWGKINNFFFLEKITVLTHYTKVEKMICALKKLLSRPRQKNIYRIAKKIGINFTEIQQILLQKPVELKQFLGY